MRYVVGAERKEFHVQKNGPAMAEVVVINELYESFDREVDRCILRGDATPKDTLQRLRD